MLKVADIDLPRLRRIFELVRTQRDAPLPLPGEWARYDYTDIACTIEVVRMCVDRDRLKADDFRVTLMYIRRACTQLRVLGLRNPLLQARLDFSGKRLVATIGGTTFDVQTGQTLIQEATEQGSAYMQTFHHEHPDDGLRRHIAEAHEQVRRQASGPFTARFEPAPRLMR
jgi:hypothetical protein